MWGNGKHISPRHTCVPFGQTGLNWPHKSSATASRIVRVRHICFRRARQRRRARPSGLPEYINMSAAVAEIVCVADRDENWNSYRVRDSN